MNIDTSSQTQLLNMQASMAQDHAVTDFSDLQKIKQQANTDELAALRQVAEQFESIFLNMVLKSMRAANEAFAEDGYFNSQQSKLYRDMYDQQISQNLTKGNGIGMADMLVKQLGGFVEQHQAVEPGENPSAVDNKKQRAIDTYSRVSQ